MTGPRREELERCGRCYGSLGLAVAFTRSLRAAADEYKTVYGWKATKPLPSCEFGAAYLANRGERRNPAVCLRASHLLGIDIDGKRGEQLLRKLVPGGLPPTVAVRSGRADGGLHLWYRLPLGAGKAKIQFADRLTLSADGYLICPPSWHAEAQSAYMFLPGCAPWEREIAPFSARLLERLDAHDRDDDEAARADDSSPIGEGERHRHLRRIAGAMRRAGAGEPAIAAALLSENARRCDPPKEERLVLALARDIATRYPSGARAR